MCIAMEIDFLAPIFGNNSIYVNNEEAKQRRNTYDVFLSKAWLHEYFYAFLEVSKNFKLLRVYLFLENIL